MKLLHRSSIYAMMCFLLLVCGCNKTEWICKPPYDTKVYGITWANYSTTLSWARDPDYAIRDYTIKVNSGPVGSGLSITTSKDNINFFEAFGITGVPGSYQIIITPNYSCPPSDPPMTTGFFFKYCDYNVTAPTGISWDNSTLTLSWNAATNAAGYYVIINWAPPYYVSRDYYTTNTSVAQFFTTLEMSGIAGTYSGRIIGYYECGYGPETAFSFVH